MVFVLERPREGAGVLSREFRDMASCRPDDLDMESGRPHEERRSAFGLEGGLVCKGIKS